MMWENIQESSEEIKDNYTLYVRETDLVFLMFLCKIQQEVILNKIFGYDDHGC